jgi:hypothetical protein
MVKGGAKYMIEYSGVLAKVMLLIVAKNIFSMTEFS